MTANPDARDNANWVKFPEAHFFVVSFSDGDRAAILVPGPEINETLVALDAEDLAVYRRADAQIHVLVVDKQIGPTYMSYSGSLGRRSREEVMPRLKHYRTCGIAIAEPFDPNDLTHAVLLNEHLNGSLTSGASQ